MSAVPPPTGSNRWSWKRTIAVAGLGSLGYFGIRFVVAFMAATAAAGETFEHDETIGVEGDTVRTTSYEIFGEHGRLTYSTSDATGPFSLYLIPSADDEAFLDGEPFRYLNGHSYIDVTAASGAIALPKGAYSFAVGCGAMDGCTIPLHVEIEHWLSSPPPSFGSAIYIPTAPSALWDHEPFTLASGETLTGLEFYSLSPGDITIEVVSSSPVSVCLVDRADVALVCEDDVRTMKRTLLIEPDDYVLDVSCAADSGLPCHGELHVVFAPLK